MVKYDMETLKAKAAKIELLLMDCDGVLTDGSLFFSSDGEAFKVFNVRDGQGINDWHSAGFHSGVISGRGAEGILKKRCEELGMKFLITDSKDKGVELNRILEIEGLSADQVAFIGDDKGDIEILRRVGFPVAVADAAEDLKECVIHTTESKGGRGAVRELIELLLRLKTS